MVYTGVKFGIISLGTLLDCHYSFLDLTGVAIHDLKMPSQSVPNGDIGAEINKGNSMPLTEYAATPLGTDFVEEPTNYGVPQNYLLSSGLPDVRSKSR